MSRVVAIYAQNEEMAALKPVAARLQMKGATIVWRAVKFEEVVRADQVLTLPQHLPQVKRIFASTGTPVIAIDEAYVSEQEVLSSTKFPENAGVPLLILPGDVGEPTLNYAAPTVHEEEPAIQITVSEAKPPAHPRRTRKSELE